jgi:two-component system, sensor histidine kinase and response regulator
MGAADGPERVPEARADAGARERGYAARLTESVRDELFQGILDNVNAVIYVKDADGRYLLVNREFERIRSLKAEEILGRNEEEIGSDELAKRIRAADRAVIETGAPMSSEQGLLTPDGQRIFLSVKFPVQTEDGAVTAIAGFSTDITDQKDALAQAVEASRLKSAFVANVSHEIRTPLNGVVGMTNLLRDTSLDPVQREYADALAASSEALLGVINEILDFSKIEAGHLELDLTDFELRSAVEDACLMLAEQAHTKGLQISHWVDADLPTTVTGDRGRLRQILLNLLSNAVKFTASGEVVVRVSDDGGEAVRFEVSDTGAGIEEGQATHLFEAFVQADQSTTRRYGGTGLGLAISRELAHRMGGAIGAEPREGGGSLFWFTAKLAAVATAEEPVRPHREFLGLRALIVDDNATNRTIFEQYLRAWGLTCESVDRPSAAITALEHASRRGQPFELALLDFNMPQMNGMELARAIRERPALRALRILILSSSPLEREVFAGIEISALLTKPARQSQLYEAIAAAIAGSSPHTEPAPEVKTQAEPNGPLVNGPLVLLAEDNKINRTVANALLTKHGLRTAVAHNGREAAEMALANDYAAILMDCQMPELDGYEATRRIRAEECGRHVPIIAMTAHSMPGDRERCLAAGMDDYLSKPVRAEQLEAIVRQWLSRDEPDTHGTGNNAVPDVERGSEDDDEVLNQATIVQLRETLTLEMRESLIQEFEASLPKCVAETVSAAHRGDQIELRRAAHMLKGTAATLGATRLRLACQRLEHTGRDRDPAVDRKQLDQLQAAASETREALGRQLLGTEGRGA